MINDGAEIRVPNRYGSLRASECYMSMRLERDWCMYVNGTFVPRENRELLEVVNPATGSSFATAPAGTADDIGTAVEAAREAFDDWRWRSPTERADPLFAIADAIANHREELIELETLENGKPLYQSANDVAAAEKTFRFYAGAADKFYGDAINHSPEAIRQTVHEPYGVVGVVIPWNWPPMHTADFAAPALATGNTVVIKPAPETPLSSLRIAELADDYLPDGVLNVVSGGVEPGVALTSHPDVDMISFTGNDTTGEKVLAAAATHITPTMMELGGKNPAIVFPDADFEQTVSGIVRSAFYNSGQACSGSERLLIHEEIYDKILDALAPRVEEIQVGDGRDESTQVGPMTTDFQRDKVTETLAQAEEGGAEVVAQAEIPEEPRLADGFWAPPTLLANADKAANIVQEEVFGPVIVAMPFTSIESAIDLANDTNYGLTGSIWTHDLRTAHRVAARLEVGLVAINNPNRGGLGIPFGGYGRSGIGRKKDFTETLREFTQPKAIRLDLGEDIFDL